MPLTEEEKALLATPEQPGVLSDVGQTLLGLPRTAAEGLAGMGGNLFNLQSFITGKVMSKLGYSPEAIAAKQAEWDKERWFGDSGEVSQAVTQAATGVGVPAGVEEASRYQPQTRTGKVVQTAGLLVPALASGGGTLPSNVISRVAAPTALIEGGAEVGKAMGDEDLGRVLGGVASLFVPSASNRISSPHPAEPGRVRQAGVLDRAQVPYTAGQRTGNERLLYRESTAGGIPAQQAQGPAFTAASARTQGGFPPNTNTLSRPTMRGELDRMGAEFDRMADISDAPLTQQLQNGLLDTVIRYQEMPIVGTAVQNTVDGLARSAARNGNRISGAAYKDTNSKISDIIRNTDDDALRGAMIEIKNQLDDAVQASLPAAEQASWSTVRQQYRDFLPIEKARSALTGPSARGTITPSALRTGIKSVEGPREVAAGSRPMTELAEAGASIIERVPQSGTVPRLFDRIAGAAPIVAGGGATSLALQAGLPGSLAALLGTGVAGTAAVVPHLRNAYIRSDLGQALAGRQGPRFPAGSGISLPSAAVPAFTGMEDPVPVEPLPPAPEQRTEMPVPIPEEMLALLGGRRLPMRV